MKSYTTLRTLYQSLTRNQASANLTLGDQFINDRYRRLCGMRDWPFLRRVRTLSTSANTQFQALPYDCDKVIEVSVIPNGQSTRYTLRESPSADHWDRLNLTSITSTTPLWYFIRAGQIGIWPTPVNTGDTIYISQRSRVIDLSIADYTTGGILTLAAAGTPVTGTGTSWATSMAGRYIRITYSDTANKGDGLWYEISSVASTTSLTLVRAYGGTAISAGNAAYTIGQMPLLPENYHDLPAIGGAADYWAQNDNLTRAADYEEKWNTRVAELVRDWSNVSDNYVIDDGRPDEIINPNLTISL